MPAKYITRDTKGRLELELTFDVVGYDQFDSWAQRFLDRHHGEATRKIDGPDARVWYVTRRGEPLLLIFDDFPLQTILVAETPGAERVLRQIAEVEPRIGPPPPDTPLAEGEFRCLRCKCVVPKADDRCSVCGWTWT